MGRERSERRSAVRLAGTCASWRADARTDPQPPPLRGRGDAFCHDARRARAGGDRAARRDHRRRARRRRGGGHADRALFQDAPLCRIEGSPRGARAGLCRDPARGRAAGERPRGDARRSATDDPALAAAFDGSPHAPAPIVAGEPVAAAGRRAGLAGGGAGRVARRRTSCRRCSTARRSTCASTG